MNIKDKLTVKIIKQDHSGRGIAKEKDLLIFVNGGITNEVCDVEIVEVHKNYLVANIINLIDKSSDRITSECPYYDLCGGCDLLHMNYSYENKIKENTIYEVFEKYANIKLDKIDLVSCNEFYYRNKITLHGKNNKLGYYEKNSLKIVEIDHCLLASNSINSVISNLKKLSQNSEIKEVIIRNVDEDILISLDGKISISNIEKYLTNKLIKTIILNNKVIKGNGFITEEILGNKFIITNKSFFQINKNITKEMYSYIINLVKDCNYNTVLDLYCGTGTIGILLSNYVKKVIGIELNKEAYLSALENKELNSVSNIAFIKNTVEKSIKEIDKILDLIVVDPPRSGLDNITIQNINRLYPKKIIYVSCDLFTLCRDLNLLKDDYEIEAFNFFNMFPRTKHVESVVLMTKVER